jgi:hypothetical protein
MTSLAQDLSDGVRLIQVSPQTIVLYRGVLMSYG